MENMTNKEFNSTIDLCINTTKKLIFLNCRDHAPFRGCCGNCGRYTNYEILPDPEVVIHNLEKLKKNENNT